jgi:hypothetical protein
MANLYQTLVAIARAASDGPDGAPKLYQPGTVVSVKGDGTYEVKTPAGTFLMNPETDLPLAPGARVNWSPVENGKPVVHGPRYGA